MRARRSDRRKTLDDLYARISGLLLERGWNVLEPYYYRLPGPYIVAGGGLGSFSHPLRDDFVGIALFGWEQGDERQLAFTASIGIIYTPARELLRTFVGSDVVGVALKQPRVTVQAPSVSDDLMATAEQLTNIVSTPALTRLGEFADIDAMLRLLKEQRAIAFDGDLADIDEMDAAHAEHTIAQLEPALLASSGRYPEARRALGAYHRAESGDGWHPREYCRFARQLTRFVTAQGELPLPTTPPYWRPGRPMESSDLPNREPVGEHASRVSDRRPHAWEYESKTALNLELALVSSPERASYPVLSTSHRRVTIKLVSSTGTPDDGRERLAIRLVEVWFTWDTSAPMMQSSLNVYIGTKRVARLDGDVADLYRPAMEAAAERDEDPCEDAYLTATSDGMWRLEIPLPA